MVILHLTEAELPIVMNALAERPLKEVGNLYGKLSQQISEQQKVPPIGTQPTATTN